MPRQQRTSSRTRSPTNRSATTAQAPLPQKTVQQPPAQSTQSSGGMFSGLGGTLMQGMAFGAGSEVAHQAIRGIMGSGGSQTAATQPSSTPAAQASNSPVETSQKSVCQDQAEMFGNCLKQHSDVSFCQSYFDQLKECQKKANV